MLCDTKITYINRSLNKDMPKIFIFSANELPSFNALQNGIAWKVIESIGQDSMSTFTYPVKTEIFATWEQGSNQTKSLTCLPGKRYTVTEKSSGIVLIENGNAVKGDEIELTNEIKVQNGVSAYLSKNDKVLISKKIVAYGQKASFKLKPKLYWGIASEIQTSHAISSAVLDSDSFFEQNLENVSAAKVVLTGNAKEGYSFFIEEQE
ncbi:hypothetical protein [Shewanella woodyi]|uniref:Uncharacterized protein n=1 Tax=Shewanella woodyi (strain ATCC 51908 / MS32) TaxID=392500 RepID=B1KF94_SHEWM|nr:hypothetical protein [Shewanella woodyi]ACA86635.1 conserved hypothetical protein [Shewanella woodyi ATCC 51908]